VSSSPDLEVEPGPSAIERGTAMYEDLIFEKKGPVTRITLNRPAKHNALTISLQKQLHEAVREVKFDVETRVLVITGAGSTFCAGDDIVEMPILATRAVSATSRGILPDPSEEPTHFMLVRMFQETAQMIEDLDCVTIAAVDGVCMGGGLELTLVCDFVLATPRSRWGMPEIDIGITPGWGGCTRMQRFVGRRKCKEINLIGYEFDGCQAEELGLVNRLVEPRDMESEIQALTDLMLAKSRYGIRRTKFVLNKAAEGHLAQAMAFEVPVDPAAGPQDTDGFRNFADKTRGWKELRSRSRGFWRD
jgi:enoyl-CoA hydratase/carnithine racemase